MERAPLRPVPARPPSPVDPAEAVRHVSAELSALDAPAAEALALVTLAGRPRDEVAGQAGLSREQLAVALARARKALRRRLHPLPGSGWCERAERLISDRLDDALEDPGPARLEVHLANCSRCVEHERRLAQAQEALVTGFVESPTPPPERDAQTAPEADTEAEAPDEPASAAPAALRIVDPGSATAPAAGPGAPTAPEDAPATPDAPEPATLGDDAPIALPPAEEAPALPDPDEPEALPEPEDPAALPDGEPAPAIGEPEGSPMLGEAEEPAVLGEGEEPAVLGEPEEPAVLGEADEPPAHLADVVPMPTGSRPAGLAPATAAALDRAEPPAPQPLRAPTPTPARLPRRSPSPTPEWTRLAATYAPASGPEGSRVMANDDTLSAVGPLLAILTLGLVMLAFAVLAVGI